jgi:hypothetical protein
LDNIYKIKIILLLIFEKISELIHSSNFEFLNNAR